MTDKKSSATTVSIVQHQDAISPEATLENGKPCYYILDSQNKIIRCNYLAFKLWHDTIPKLRRTLHGRKLLDTRNRYYRVVTSFLGHAHGFDEENNPVLWETLTISENGIDVQRYVSYNDAMRGHHAQLRILSDILRD